MIQHGSRRGLAAALNTGVAASDADIIVHFDADAYPPGPFVDVVRSAFRADERLGLLGFRCRDEHGRETPSLAEPPGLLPFLLGQRVSSLFRRIAVRVPLKQPVPTLAGLALRRSAHSEVGGFDEDLGFLDVDVDFGLRLRNEDWRVDQEPTLSVFHVGGGSRLDTGERLERFYRDRWRTLRKHRRMGSPGLVRSLVRARLGAEVVALSALASIRGENGGRLRAAAEGRKRARAALADGAVPVRAVGSSQRREP